MNKEKLHYTRLKPQSDLKIIKKLASYLPLQHGMGHSKRTNSNLLLGSIKDISVCQLKVMMSQFLMGMCQIFFTEKDRIFRKNVFCDANVLLIFFRSEVPS